MESCIIMTRLIVLRNLKGNEVVPAWPCRKGIV